MSRKSRRTVVLSTAAVNDLDELWLYMAEDNPDAADRYVDQLTARCHLLGQNSEVGRPREELAAGLRSFAYRNHLIFYRVGPDRVEVARILSGYRDLDELF